MAFPSYALEIAAHQNAIKSCGAHAAQEIEPDQDLELDRCGISYPGIVPQATQSACAAFTAACLTISIMNRIEKPFDSCGGFCVSISHDCHGAVRDLAASLAFN